MPVAPSAAAKRDLKRGTRLGPMRELPVPDFYRPERVGEVWRVPYEERARDARPWAAGARDPAGLGGLASASACSPSTSRTRSASRASSSSSAAGPGRARSTTTAGCASSSTATSGRSRRSSRASTPTTRCRSSTRSGSSTPTGTIPRRTRSSRPRTSRAGRWRVNPAVAESLGIDPDYAARQLAHYTRALAEGGKYELTIWPYHALLGGIGHALVSAVEEAFFFHGDRARQPARLPGQGRATRSPSTTRCSARR